MMTSSPAVPADPTTPTPSLQRRVTVVVIGVLAVLLLVLGLIIDVTATELVHPLPDGGRVILVADTTQTTQVTRQLRQLMIGAGAATLLVAALLLIAVSRVALRPLDRLTALATNIATGHRGRRLRPQRTDTELGRAAAAFDGMLDALEASERRAQQAAAAAERAEAATRRFLVDAAHELRTPIAGVQVAAEQLVANAGRHQ